MSYAYEMIPMCNAKSARTRNQSTNFAPVRCASIVTDKRATKGHGVATGKIGMRDSLKCELDTNVVEKQNLRDRRLNTELTKNNYKEKSTKRRRQCANFVRQYKTGKSCADCGIAYPPWILDFDHREPGNKVMNVSLLAGSKASLKTILAEIEKCDLICANCHRQRSYLAGYCGNFVSEDSDAD